MGAERRRDDFQNDRRFAWLQDWQFLDETLRRQTSKWASMTLFLYSQKMDFDEGRPNGRVAFLQHSYCWHMSDGFGATGLCMLVPRFFCDRSMSCCFKIITSSDRLEPRTRVIRSSVASSKRSSGKLFWQKYMQPFSWSGWVY